MKLTLPHDIFADKDNTERQLISSSIMDSLLFAGGVSVPSVINMCVALIADAGGSDVVPAGPAAYEDLRTLTLTDANAGQFVWETIRRYPPVGALSYQTIVKEAGRSVPGHQVYANLFMAAQDPLIFAEPDEWKLRKLETYKRGSVMFADQALQDGRNLGPHSHACPAKDLTLQIAIRFMKCLSKQAFTMEGTNVMINEYGAANVVTLRTKNNTNCALERQRGRRCIDYQSAEGDISQQPHYTLESFDSECFAAGKAKPNCIAYNQASWPWLFMSLFVLVLFGNRIPRKLPSLGFIVRFPPACCSR